MRMRMSRTTRTYRGTGPSYASTGYRSRYSATTSRVSSGYVVANQYVYTNYYSYNYYYYNSVGVGAERTERTLYTFTSGSCASKGCVALNDTTRCQDSVYYTKSTLVFDSSNACETYCIYNEADSSSGTERPTTTFCGTTGKVDICSTSAPCLCSCYVVQQDTSTTKTNIGPVIGFVLVGLGMCVCFFYMCGSGESDGETIAKEDNSYSTNDYEGQKANVNDHESHHHNVEMGPEGGNTHTTGTTTDSGVQGFLQNQGFGTMNNGSAQSPYGGEDATE